MDINKLEKFFTKELTSELKDVMIINDGGNNYELFGKYFVSPTPSGYFKVSIKTAYEVHEFANVRNAVTWCIFDNAKKYSEANRIKDLDLRLCSMEVDLAIHKKMAKNAKDPSNKWIYLIKLQEDNLKKKMMLNEMSSYINTSKTIQAQKFRKTKKPDFSHMR
jgi:hypothetical protein